MKQKKVKISVLMGVYNPREEYLLKAIHSIQKQTFSQWELLLYDDGSDKEKAEMLRKIADIDDRIRLIRGEENKGLAYGLNICIQAAKGEYAARMDDDDISKKERLLRLYTFLENNREYAWAGSNAELIDERGVWGTERMKERPQPKDFLPYSPYIHPSVMFRMEALKAVDGYRESAETRRCEDYDLFMRLHAAGLRGYNLQENLLQYREDKEGYKKRKYRCRIQEMKVRYQGFKKLGILNPYTVPYVVKPAAVGLVHREVLRYLRKRAS